jgi:hypothetical protein
VCEDYRKQIEEAAQAVLREVGKGNAYLPDKTKERMVWHLETNSELTTPTLEQVRKGRDWAAEEYYLIIFQRAHLDYLSRAHKNK